MIAYRTLVVALIFLVWIFPGILLNGQSSSDSFPVSWKDEAVNALSLYVQIPSISGSEAEAGQFFAGLCREKDLHVFQMGAENGACNFTASLYPLALGKPNIVFLNHIDVVAADMASLWTYAPFSGAVAEGMVWGRGSFDNKGLGVMQLFAIAAFAERAEREDLPFNVSLLAVSCEETQCDGGVRSVIDHYLDVLNPVVVFGEGPASLDGVVPSHPEQMVYAIALAHKRALWLELRSEVACMGHGSVTPTHYANKELVHALDRLTHWKPRIQLNAENVRILKDLGRLEGGVKGFFLKHPRLWKPLLAPALRKEPALGALFMDNCTATVIRADAGAINVIPQQGVAWLDCRLLPETDRDRFLRRLEKRLDTKDVGIEIILEMPQVKPSSCDSPFFRVMEQTIHDHHPEAAVLPIILPNFTDDGWFRAAGVPCYSSMPVYMSREQMENVHGVNESMAVESLWEGIVIYVDLIDRILNGFTGVEE
jgi:acetylornithine deacetylase/succinyl-diaminopimelate desuccinylase-like protein